MIANRTTQIRMTWAIAQWRTFIVAIGVMAIALQGFAQAPEPEAAPPAEETAATPPAPPPPPASEVPVPTGDVIHLKGGKSLTGVQVIRKTPTGILVEVYFGVAPITIMQSQIESIDYDNFDPRRDKRPEASSAASGDSIGIPGLQLSPELSKNLNTPLGEPAIAFEKVDIVDALKQLAERGKIVLEADASVTELPAESRTWSTTTKPDTKLLNMLRDDFSAAFPDLEVVYKFDRVIVMTKDAAAAARAKEESAAKETPAADAAPNEK